MPRSEWKPLNELRTVQKRLNQLFEAALAHSNYESPEGFDSWTPVCDAYETDRAVVVCLELPGLEQSAIDLRIDGDELVVEGERRMDGGQSGERYHRVERSFGRFQRRFHLPSDVDRDAVSAAYHDGLLRVEMPRQGRRAPGAIKVDIR